MVTEIKFKDGTNEFWQNGAPAVSTDNLDVVIINDEADVVSREFTFEEIESVTFRPEDPRPSGVKKS